ncbi:MAG: hypothetical protein HC767_06380 [Akkermansiaceae bacterium]|nr:hypothetical protein [Akkermansiaceae bacterium]
MDEPIVQEVLQLTRQRSPTLWDPYPVLEDRLIGRWVAVALATVVFIAFLFVWCCCWCDRRGHRRRSTAVASGSTRHENKVTTSPSLRLCLAAG